MLTGFAILERELGAIDYARHRLEAGLRQRGLSAPEARRLRAELEKLEARRQQTLARLDELHDEWDERHPAAES